MQVIEAKIEAMVEAFPSMPGSAVKLLAMLEEPSTGAAEVEGVLRYDAGLTANVLRLTNSAYFGLPCRVGSIRQAAVLLGKQRLLQLVMAASLNAILDNPVEGYELAAGELWRHSFAVSTAAEDLARTLALDGEEMVSTAALLHDLGKLVLGRWVAQDAEAIEAEAGRGVSFEVAERIRLGTDHAQVGARILRRWSLPAPLVAAVRWHHAPDEAPRPDAVTDAVHVANVLCLMIGIGMGREGLRYTPAPGATRRLGVKPATLEGVASRTLYRMDSLQELFE